MVRSCLLMFVEFFKIFDQIVDSLRVEELIRVS